jgi:hypothetical protein
MRHRRFALEYLTLVGLPFLGVMGVLRIGGHYAAPPSIDGKWSLDARFDENDNTPCAEHLAVFREPSFRIRQAGVFVEVTLFNAFSDRLHGRFDGGHFVAEVKPRLFGDDVFDLLRVYGTLTEADGRRLLRGVIAMPRRIDCAPIPYIASPEPLQPDHQILGLP